MDATTKLAIAAAVATVLGASIGAGATVYAARLNVIKPTATQVERSDIYKRLLDANETLRLELRDSMSKLRDAAASGDKAGIEMSKRRDAELSEIKELLSALQRENASLRAASILAAPQTAAGPATLSATSAKASMPTALPSVRRTELMLRPAVAHRISEDVTVTAEPFNPGFGLTLVINGGRVAYLRPGDRAPASKTSVEECYFEVMSLPKEKQSAETNEIRVDYVCRRRS